MRRVSAILLAAIFSFGLIGPEVFGADVTPKLPSCCRKDGKHRCAGDHSSKSTSDRAVRAERCASFPDAKSLPAPRIAAPSTSTKAVFLEIAHIPVSRPQIRALIRLSHGPGAHKRGPPSLFS